MPVFNRKELLQDLEASVRRGIDVIAQLRISGDARLSAPGANNSWSIAQHLHHLNFYAAFYTEAIEHCVEQASSSPKEVFKSGWLGNYFTNIIGPAAEEQPLKVKMKSPANAIPPASSELNVEAELETFLGFQHRLLYLLQRARQVDLGAHRVPTSLSKLVRLKLGDSFRFVIAHQERHFQHIERNNPLG
jgi:hypothetical protein